MLQPLSGFYSQTVGTQERIGEVVATVNLQAVEEEGKATRAWLTDFWRWGATGTGRVPFEGPEFLGALLYTGTFAPLRMAQDELASDLAHIGRQLDQVMGLAATGSAPGTALTPADLSMFWQGVRRPDRDITDPMFQDGRYLALGVIDPIRANLGLILRSLDSLTSTVTLPSGQEQSGGLLGGLGDILGFLTPSIPGLGSLPDLVLDVPGQVATLVTDGLWSAVRGAQEGIASALGQGLEFFFRSAGGLVGTALGSGLREFLEELEIAAVPFVSPISKELMERGAIPAWLMPAITEAQQPTSQWGSLIQLTLQAVGMLGAILPALSYQGEFSVQEVRKLSPHLLPDPATQIIADFRGVRGFYSLPDSLSRLGYSEDYQEVLDAALRPILGVGDITALHHRFGLADEITTDRLERLGYSNFHARQLLSIMPTLPGVNDVVRFSVREAYRDDVVIQFALDEGFETIPPLEYGRLGLATEDMKHFWRSHWELPSLGQAFEMYHRTVAVGEGEGDIVASPFPGGGQRQTVIGLDTVQTLLRTQDIMQYFREPLTKIAYQVPTRVDIRRFFEVGIVDEHEVYFTYLDQGFNPDNAERNARFAIADAFTTAYTYRQTEVRGQVRNGLMSPAEAATILSEEGPFELRPIFRADVLAETIRTMEIDRQGERNAEERSAWIRAYRTRLVPQSELEGELKDIGMSDKEIIHTIALENLDIRIERQQDIAGALRRAARLEGHKIGSARLQTQLTAIGVPPAEVTHLVREAQAWKMGDPNAIIPEPYEEILEERLVFETAAGRLQASNLRQLFRARSISAVALTSELLALEMPVDQADAFVEFEVNRLVIAEAAAQERETSAARAAAARAAERAEAELTRELERVTTAAQRILVRTSRDRFRAQEITAPQLRDQLVQAGTPVNVAAALVQFEVERLERELAEET